MGAQVACAAKGSRVAVAYVDAAGTGIKLRESTDNGATYAAEVAVTTAAASVNDLALAYKNTSGDLAVAWAAGTSVGIIKRTSGVFGSPATTSPGVSSLNGVAMTYGFDWDIVLTGVEATTLQPSLWTIVYGDGVDAPANTWGTLFSAAAGGVRRAGDVQGAVDRLHRHLPHPLRRGRRLHRRGDARVPHAGSIPRRRSSPAPSPCARPSP